MVAWWVFAWCIFPRILLSTCLGLYDENTSLVGSMGLGPWCSGEMGFTKSDVLFAVNHFSPTAHKGSFYSGGRDLRFCPFRQPRPLNRGVQTIRCGPWCDSVWSCHLAFCFPFVTFFVLFFLFVPSFGLRIFMIGICFPYKVLIIIVPVFFGGGLWDLSSASSAYHPPLSKLCHFMSNRRTWTFYFASSLPVSAIFDMFS